MKRWIAALLIILIVIMTLVFLLIASLDIIFSELENKNTAYVKSPNLEEDVFQDRSNQDYLNPDKSGIHFGPPLD